MRFLSALAITLVAVLPLAHAGDDGISGNWKISILQKGNQMPFWLLSLEIKGGKLNGTVETLAGKVTTILMDAKINGDLLEYTLKLANGEMYSFQGKAPKAGAKKIFGSLAGGTLIIPAIMEATSAKTGFEMEREIVLRTPNDPRVFNTVLSLISQASEQKVPAKEVQEWADTALRSAVNYGPRWQLDVAQELVEALLMTAATPTGKGAKSEGYPTVAVEIARKAQSLMDAKAPLQARLGLLTGYASALRQAGQGDQLKDLEKRLEFMENQAYTEYKSGAEEFKVAKFAGRKLKGNRAVLVELFTGAQCPPCVAADLAFDTIPRAYDAKEIVLLQYHLHIPKADALTNNQTEERADFYGDKIRGTPTVLFNGRVVAGVGGGIDDVEEVFGDLRKAIDPLLEIPAGAQIQLSAARKADKIQIKANVQGLEKPGDKMKLRLALVEDWTRYKGRNGLSYYHNVVRSFPGGIAGLALTKKDMEQTATVDLNELRTTLNKYLDKTAMEVSFLDSQRPMRLRNLSIVAFVQNDATQEILQAAKVAVKDE